MEMERIDEISHSRNSLRNTALTILMLGLLSVFPFLLYSDSLIIDTSGEPNFDPLDFFERILYSWDSRYAPGRDTFPSFLLFHLGGFYAFFSVLGVPVFVIERAWFSLLLFVSGMAMFYFTGILKLRFSSRIVSSLFYMFNPYTLVIFNITSDFLWPYATLPFLLGIWHSGIKNSPRASVRNALLLGLVCFFAFPHNVTFVVILTLVLGFYFIYYIAVVDRTRFLEKIKFSLTALLLVGMSSAWWLLPAFSYAVTDAGVISANLGAETPLMYNSHSSYPETFRLLGFWGFYSGYRGKPYFNYSPTYLYNPYIIFISFTIPVISISAFLFCKGRRRQTEKRYVVPFLALLFLFSIPMAVGAYPPQNPTGTGLIYQWLYDHVPGFQIFRGGYKFQMLTAFGYAVLLGILFDEVKKYLITRINLKRGRQINRVLLVAFICLILVNSYPFFIGSLFEDVCIVDKVPSYWSAMAEWINKQPDDSKIFLTPDPYAPVYVWDTLEIHTRSDVSISLIKKPQIFQMFGIRSHYIDELTNLGYYLMKINSTVDLGRILGLMNVGYVLQRNDVDWSYYGSIKPEQIKGYLTRQKGIQLVQTFCQLDLYENNFSLPEIYAGTSITEVCGGPRALLGLASVDWMDNNTVVLISDSIDKSNHLQDTCRTNFSLPWSGIFFNTSDVVFTVPGEGLYEIGLDLPILFLQEETGFRINLRQIYTDLPNNLFVDLIDMSRNGTYILTNHIGDIPFYGEETFIIQSTDPRLLSWKLENGTTLQVQLRNDYAILGRSNSIVVGNPISIRITVDEMEYTVSLADTKSRYLIAEVFLSHGIHRMDFDTNDGQSVGFIYVKPVDLDIQSVKMTYATISPTSHLVHVNSSAPFFLVLSESFSSGWKLYSGQVDLVTALLSKPIDEDCHEVANYGFANAWYIDKPGNYTFTLLYYPQVMRNLGATITMIFYGSIIIYFGRLCLPVVSSKLRKKLRKTRLTNGCEII